MHSRSRPVISGIAWQCIQSRLGGYVVACRVLEVEPVKGRTESTLDQARLLGMDQSCLLEKAKEAPATRFRAPASGKGALDILHTTSSSGWVASVPRFPPRLGGVAAEKGRARQPSSLWPPNHPVSPKPSSNPVGCVLMATLPLPDWYMSPVFTGQSKGTLGTAMSESLLIMLADTTGNQMTRASTVWSSVTVWP